MKRRALVALNEDLYARNYALRQQITECESVREDALNKLHEENRQLHIIANLARIMLDENGEPLALVVNPHPFSDAHFATFPPDLVEPFILAGSPKQCCPTCGAGWQWSNKGRSVNAFCIRLRDDQAGRTGQKSHFNRNVNQQAADEYDDATYGGEGRVGNWSPTCDCEGNDGSGRALVLDPFAGAGTVGLVCCQHGRRFVGLDASLEYCRMANARIAEDAAPKPSHAPYVLIEEQLEMF